MISVIIPVYNAEKHLRECIDSVIHQSVSDIELLLVDDGSTDTSSSICDAFAQIDSRIKVLHQNNQGVAAARNSGVKNAEGTYIAFLDADDRWDPSFLEKMLIDMRNADFSICNIIRFKDQIYITPMKKKEVNGWCWPIIEGDSVSCWRGLFKKDILLEKNIWFSPGRRTGEDQEFTFKYMIHMNHIVFSEDALYYYRIDTASVMHQKDRRHFDAVDAMESFLQYAEGTLSGEKYGIIKETIKGFRIPKLIEFAVTTVLSGGEKPKDILGFLRQRGYDAMLNEALTLKKHYRSSFMQLWRISPGLCTRYIYNRKKIGQKLRRIELIK